jgi:hypothetical protein
MVARLNRGKAGPIYPQKNDIGQRDIADWPKPSHSIADRQQSIGVNAGRQAERGLRFLLDCKYSVVNVAPRPSALAASSKFCTAG